MPESERRENSGGSRPAEQDRDQDQDTADRIERKLRDYWRVVDPGTAPAEVAELIVKWDADWTGAGNFALRRLEGGVPLAEVAETARILLAGAGESAGRGALSFAAAVAHAEGDEGTEHRYTAELLARAKAGDGDRPPLDVALMISHIGHPGEGIELAEPYLRGHPGDEQAADTYRIMLRAAAEMAAPGEKERAALSRFSDRSGLSEIKRAVMRFLDRGRWGDLVRDRAVTAFEQVPGKILAEPETGQCAALAFEAAVWGTQEEAGHMTPEQLIGLYRDGLVPDTPLTAFAADPEVGADCARRVSDWARHGSYGLWQLMYPETKPGVYGRDLISGIGRYLAFPPEIIDGTAKWSVWLGGALPVDGVWRVTGTGLMLSPAEADAVAAAIDELVGTVTMTLSGVPLAELLPASPIPFGKAPPWGVRWDYRNPLGPEYARSAGGVLMMLGARIAGQVFKRRMRYGRPDARVPEDGDAWLREPLSVLKGRTPLQAAADDEPWQMLVESQLRQFEYQGADADRLRAALGWGEEE